MNIYKQKIFSPHRQLSTIYIVPRTYFDAQYYLCCKKATCGQQKIFVVFLCLLVILSMRISRQLVLLIVTITIKVRKRTLNN